MGLDGISAGFSASGGGSGFNIRLRLQEDQALASADQDASEGSAAESELSVQAQHLTRTSSSTSSASQNMLARNFAGGVSNESEYLNATLASFKIENGLKNSADQAGFTLIDQAKAMAVLRNSKGSKYTEGLLATKDVERLVNNEKNRETIKEAELHLDKAREDIEEAAEEATAPKDENGQPIEIDPQSPAEALQADEPATVSDAVNAKAESASVAPDVSATGSQTSLAQSEDDAVVNNTSSDTLVGAAQRPNVPSVESIDIIV